MSEFHYLTETDVLAIKELLDLNRNGLLVRQQQGSYEDSRAGGEDHQAPETYIGFPKETSGIPGLEDVDENGTAAGTATVPRPGSALCNIFKLVTIDGIQQLVDTGMEKTVYNLTTAVIPQTYITIARDKYGTWIAVNSAGTPAPYYITQTDNVGTGSGTGTGERDAAIYKGVYPDGFLARRAKWDTGAWRADLSVDEETIYLDFCSGVMFTNDLILTHKIQEQRYAIGGYANGHYFNNCKYLGNSQALIYLNVFAQDVDTPVVPVQIPYGDPPLENTSVSLIFDAHHQLFVLLQAACP